VSLRNKMAERARPYLEPGEQIQAVFRAQSRLSPNGVFLAFFVFLLFICIFTWAYPPTALLPVTVAAVGAVVALWTVLTVFVRVHHVVVTDRAIVVLDVNRYTNRPTRLRSRLPRIFYFGPMSRPQGKFVLDNTKYWVPRQFEKDVTAADAALAQMTQPGPTGTAE
jgi:hypothetical protein